MKAARPESSAWLEHQPLEIANKGRLSHMRFDKSRKRKFERVILIIERIRDLGVAGSNPVPGTIIHGLNSYEFTILSDAMR